MKRTGDACNVRIIRMINDRTAIVVDENNDISGKLKIKGNLKIRSDGTVKVWILKEDSQRNNYIFGNSYFGKYEITDSIINRYVTALERILGFTDSCLEADDISVLKGMVNRCLKRDQWDWYTTYTYLGYPSYQIQKEFVQDSVRLRKALSEGNNDSIQIFVDSYRYMLTSIYSHLKNCVDVNDEMLDIPISGFDKTLWEKLLYESRKNILLVERTNKNVSNYLLMHYFVTLEQEFQNNYLTPFQLYFRSSLNSFKLSDKRWKITHDLLCGNTHFSLGAVYYLGKCCRDKSAVTASEAISSFVSYLGANSDHFSQLCNAIAIKKLCGYTLKDLRNGLAHGDITITNAIDKNAFCGLRNFLFTEPEAILKDILIYSMNY